MGYMFNEYLKLKEIKGIDKFNTSEVTTMKGMFQWCQEIKYLNLSKLLVIIIVPFLLEK